MKSELKKKRKLSNKYKIMENNWDERFILEKIPQYDAYKDINYLSLGLVKSKLRYEEKQLKESQKKNRKLRTNSSRLTLNTKPKKSIYTPLLTSLKENEKNDFLSLKHNKRPLTIKRRNIKMNKTTEFNMKDKKDDKNSYIKTYENKNKNQYNNNNKQNNVNTNPNINANNNDKECIVIDKELEKELNEIKELWDNLGVTPEYQIYFGEMLDRLKTKDIIKKYLSLEKRQLVQFKLDLEKLMNDIYKRENDLNNLKKIDEIYSKNEQLNKYNILKNKKTQKNKNNSKNNTKNGLLLGENDDEIVLYKSRNVNGNQYDEDNVEKSKEFDEELMKYKVNKEKIENDIGNCLKLLRLHTINTVNQFTKFRINYNFYFTSGKNDVNQMKNGYEFDYNYLLKIKKDCEFFKKCSIKDVYNFSPDCENDPFFLNLLQNNKENNNNKNEYKYLTATEDTINNINHCMFILDQEEMYFKISQNQNNANNNNNNNNNDNESDNNNSYTNNKTNQIGTNFQGNLENVISKLRSQNEYQNLFFNSAEMKDPLIINTNMTENLNNKYEQGPKKIPETTSKELFQSFEYYDKIKTNIYNKEEIQNIQSNVHKSNNNKIVIYSKNSNQNKDVAIKGSNSLNLNFNKIYKKNKNENDNNSIKISFNNINNKNNINNINSVNKNIEKKRKSFELNLKINEKNDDKKLEEKKNQENNNIDNINKNITTNTNNNNKKNIENINNIDNNNKNKDNVIINNTNINDEEEDKKNEKCINCKYTSILSLIYKNDSSDIKKKNDTHFNIGSYLFKSMNCFNLNLLLNSLKNNNIYSINSPNLIISSSFKEIKDTYNFIKNQNNNILNMNTLQNIIKEKNIYLSDDTSSSIKYAFLSSLININFKSLISSSIIYNKYKYNGIKINTSKNILSIEDDLIIYTIPTNDDNIMIYITLYNNKIKDIIKKYDKSNNIFNGFSSFVNIISLYFEDNNDNKDEEKVIWIPCFDIDTQLICNKMPGYKKINIKDSNNKDMDIFEYDEIIKINMKPDINSGRDEGDEENNKDININKDKDIIIENDFIFGLFHKEMKNKYNTPFISLAFIGNENFIKAN